MTFYRTFALMLQDLFQPTSYLDQDGALVSLNADKIPDTDSEKEQQPTDFKEEKGGK
jgi:hypothetical protein